VFMGGLNYQIEHHLFPSMARPHLRRAQPLVAAYCAAQGVPYTQTSLWQVLPRRHLLPEHGRAPWERPLPVPPRRSTPCPLARALAPLRSRRTAPRNPTGLAEDLAKRWAILDASLANQQA
jgi:hypothetical protein